jgi:alpha-D-ribose 1-methylphosphonate 5-triphosphate synthase subunit PhnH
MTLETPASPPRPSATAALEQATFRALLTAMSRPGSIHELPSPREDDGSWGAALVVLQSLLDHEVTFHVAASDGYPREQLLRRTGARVAELASADFVLAHRERALAAIEGAREGPFEEPERSATVVVLCSEVGVGEVTLRLTGPGVDGEACLSVDGVTREAFESLVARNAPFPTGIDLVLVDQRRGVACLPRSTSIQIS